MSPLRLRPFGGRLAAGHLSAAAHFIGSGIRNVQTKSTRIIVQRAMFPEQYYNYYILPFAIPNVLRRLFLLSAPAFIGRPPMPSMHSTKLTQIAQTAPYANGTGSGWSMHVRTYTQTRMHTMYMAHGTVVPQYLIPTVHCTLESFT